MNKIVPASVLRNVLGALALVSASCSMAGKSTDEEACGAPLKSPVQISVAIENIEPFANEAYFHRSPQEAIDPLWGLVTCLHHVVQKSDVDPEIRSALRYEEMVARARLSKVLASAKRATDAALQREKAYTLWHEVMKRPLVSPEELTEFIDELDKKARSRSQ